MPLESLVVEPICLVLLLESITLIVTGTPVAFVGAGCCSYKYSIHALWLASDIAGVPFAGMPRLVWPGDWSVTVPLITTVFPRGITSFVIATVVADCPWPKQ